MPAFISWWCFLVVAPHCCWCKHRHVLQVFKVAGIVQQTQQGISMRVTACQDKLQPHLPTGLCSAVLPLLSPSLRFAHCWHPVLFFCFYRTVCFGFPHVLSFSNPHCLLLFFFLFLTNFHASLSLSSPVSDRLILPLTTWLQSFGRISFVFSFSLSLQLS